MRRCLNGSAKPGTTCANNKYVVVICIVRWQGNVFGLKHRNPALWRESDVIIILWLPASVILFNFCCDAPFKVLFNIEQLRRSLPRACRRVTHLYFLFFIQLAPSSISFPKGKGAVLLYYSKRYFFHFNNRIYPNKQRTLPPKFPLWGTGGRHLNYSPVCPHSHWT